MSESQDSQKNPSPDLQINCIPLKTGLLNHHETSMYILAEFTTGSMPSRLKEKTRTPIALSIVLDRSGSMRGRPLIEAIKCAEYIIKNSHPTDFVSLVTYDNSAQLISPLLICNEENKELMIKELSKVKSGGSTNLEAGWRIGAQSIEAGMKNKLLPENTLKRVFLLSDGQLNCGIIDDSIILDSCSEFAAMGISTSTYGLGHDFNEQIMVDMSQSGEGNSYYGETVDDLMEPFVDELSLLQQLAVKNLKCSSKSMGHPAIKDITVINELKYIDENNNEIDMNLWNRENRDLSEVWCRLQNIPFDAKRNVLFKITVDLTKGNSDVQDGTNIPILTVIASYDDIDGDSKELQSEAVILPALSMDIYQELTKNTQVDEKKQELSVTQLQQTIRTHLRNGNISEARHVLDQLAKSAMNNAHLTAVIEDLRQLLESRSYRLLSKEISFNRRYYSNSLESTRSGIEDREYMSRKIRKGSSRRRRS